MNIKQIAKKSGVSVATISRYLTPSKRSLVNPKTQQRIAKIIHQFHYIPNRAARSLSTKKSDTIGIVTPLFIGPCEEPLF